MTHSDSRPWPRPTTRSAGFAEPWVSQTKLVSVGSPAPQRDGQWAIDGTAEGALPAGLHVLVSSCCSAGKPPPWRSQGTGSWVSFQQHVRKREGPGAAGWCPHRPSFPGGQCGGRLSRRCFHPRAVSPGMAAASPRLMGTNGPSRMFSGLCECSCGMTHLMPGKVVNISEFVDAAAQHREDGSNHRSVP